MRVGTRLLLAVTPAVVGLAAVAALAYWGQYQRQAPEIVVAVAALGAVASLALAWRNTRYVARRVERIAQRTADDGRRGHDELDAIEHSVAGLADAVRAERVGGAEREAAAAREARESAARLDETIASLTEGVQAVQLPLHILLDSPFGSLNENQEEMLEAARGAAEALEVRLRQARKLVELERGAVPVMAKPVGLGELMRPALAIAEARAAKRGLTLRAQLAPGAPRVVVDPAQAQEAITIVLGEAVERAEAGAELQVEAGEGEPGVVQVTVAPLAAAGERSLPLRLAEALIRAQGGSMTAGGAGVGIALPAEQVRRVQR